MLLVALLLLHGAPLSGSQPGAPQNISYVLVDSRTVKVLWSLETHGVVDKYDVSFKPAEANYRVVTAVAGNCESVILNGLQPDVQYQLTVTAVRAGIKARSRPLVFRTMPPLTSIIPLTEPITSTVSTPILVNTDDPPAALTSVTVRGVEISLVLLALCVWIFAITLFFHRWGKIRMLLPYQPDYKTQQSLKVPGTGSSLAGGSAHADGSHHDGPGCVQVVSRSISSLMQHLRWSSRYLDDPPARVCSRWSSRQRLPSFGYAADDFGDHLQHASSHASLNRLSIPVPAHRRPSRGSLYSLVDCLKSRNELPEAQPLFPETEDAAQVTETVLDSPPRRYNRCSLKKQNTTTMTTADDERGRQLTPAEIKRKTFLRKISLQETHINYNQDYWLEYDKSTRFHTSLDLGYLKSHENEILPMKHDRDTGPTSMTTKPTQQQQQLQLPELASVNAINTNPTITSRQSDSMPYTHRTTKRMSKLFLRGDSEPYIVFRKKKCCCTDQHEHSNENSNLLVFNSTSNLFANAVQSPSTENLPFLERIGQIETEFETDFKSLRHGRGSIGSDSSNAFSEISLHLQSQPQSPSLSPKSIIFDFNGGSAFFGEDGRTDSASFIMNSPNKQHDHDHDHHHHHHHHQQQPDFSPTINQIPEVSVTRPSNSPSPRSSFINFK